jgi:hypothetical protein
MAPALEGFRVRLAVRRAKQELARVARRYCTTTNVTSFSSATPERFSFRIAVLTDRVRDQMRDEPELVCLVFASRNGTPWDADVVRKRKLYPLLEKLGIERCGFHAFRRGNASVLDQQQVPMAIGRIASAIPMLRSDTAIPGLSPVPGWDIVWPTNWSRTILRLIGSMTPRKL